MMREIHVPVHLLERALEGDAIAADELVRVLPPGERPTELVTGRLARLEAELAECKRERDHAVDRCDELDRELDTLDYEHKAGKWRADLVVSRLSEIGEGQGVSAETVAEIVEILAGEGER